MQCCIPPPTSTEGSHLYTQHILQTSASAIATQEPTGSILQRSSAGSGTGLRQFQPFESFRAWFWIPAQTPFTFTHAPVPISKKYLTHRLYWLPLQGHDSDGRMLAGASWQTANKQYLGYQSATFLHGVTRGVAQ